MKRIYSIILLFSFLIGTLQPILPMIEYQLYTGNIIELLGHTKDAGKKDHAVVTITTTQQASAQSSDNDQELLNDNFYPLGIRTATLPQIIVFSHSDKLYLPPAGNLISLVTLPSPPPPRMS